MKWTKTQIHRKAVALGGVATASIMATVIMTAVPAQAADYGNAFIYDTLRCASGQHIWLDTWGSAGTKLWLYNDNWTSGTVHSATFNLTWNGQEFAFNTGMQRSDQAEVDWENGSVTKFTRHCA